MTLGARECHASLDWSAPTRRRRVRPNDAHRTIPVRVKSVQLKLCHSSAASLFPPTKRSPKASSMMGFFGPINMPSGTCCFEPIFWSVTARRGRLCGS